MQEIYRFAANSLRGPEMKIENFINCPGLGNLGVGMSATLIKKFLIMVTIRGNRVGKAWVELHSPISFYALMEVDLIS